MLLDNEIHKNMKTTELNSVKSTYARAVFFKFTSNNLNSPHTTAQVPLKLSEWVIKLGLQKQNHLKRAKKFSTEILPPVNIFITELKTT